MSSRPLSWINTAFPFAAAYLLTTRQVDATLIVGTLFFLVPYNLAMYGINDVFDYESDLRNPRKGGVEGALLDRRDAPHHAHRRDRHDRPVRRRTSCSSAPRLSWLVLAVSLFAVVAYSAPALRFKERPFARLGHLEHALRLPRGLRARARGRGVHAAAVAPCSRRSPCGASPRTRSARCRTSSPTARPDLLDRDRHRRARDRAVRARVLPRGRRAHALHELAGTPRRGARVALRDRVRAFWNVTDAAAETANRGWRRFLLLNFVTGFFVTMLLIATALLYPAS